MRYPSTIILWGYSSPNISRVLIRLPDINPCGRLSLGIHGRYFFALRQGVT